MPKVIRVGDPHGGSNGVGLVFGPGVPTVLIGDCIAATAGSVCQYPSGLVDSIAEGSPTVLVGDLPLARLGDSTIMGNHLECGASTVEAQ